MQVVAFSPLIIGRRADWKRCLKTDAPTHTKSRPGGLYWRSGGFFFSLGGGPDLLIDLSYSCRSITGSPASGADYEVKFDRFFQFGANEKSMRWFDTTIWAGARQKRPHSACRVTCDTAVSLLSPAVRPFPAWDGLHDGVLGRSA